ncbi:hypothetical protein [Micromonospora costi]|uniref:hypothetical protein n=1 Tax=Micromonospora costi TaxID=1530042 RepID=UPI001651D20A|nr:hypothetical protein [Micromonospora costi]
MSTHCLVGTTHPANPHLVHARFVLLDGHPRIVVPTLADIWAHHARYDAHALADAVLACDWEYLDPTTAALPGAAGRHRLPVGMPLRDGAPEPVTVFPLCQAQHLDAPWIYLIVPVTATVAVHTDDGHLLAHYQLDDFVRPSPATTLAAGPDGGRTAPKAPDALVGRWGAPR